MLAGTSLRKSVKYGELSVIDAKGRKHLFGGDTGPEVTIRVTDPALHFKLFHNPYWQWARPIWTARWSSRRARWRISSRSARPISGYLSPPPFNAF